MVGDGEIRTKHLEPIIVELPSIVRHYDLWDSKQTYDSLPNKSPGILLGDFGKKLCLNPLSVVYGN